MAKKNKDNPAELLEDAGSLFGVERRNLKMKDALALKYQKKVKSLIKRYGEPFDDGFQLKDIGTLAGVTQDLIEYVDRLSSLSNEEKRGLVVSCGMLAYKEYGKKLPWIMRWVPDSWVRSAIGSAVDGLVKYMKKKGVL